MSKVRVAFFADLHIRGNKLQVQTDIGAPCRWLAKKAQKAINDIQPDYVFGLGDLTAEGSSEDWQGYKKWLAGIDAPVFDLFGNHDRDYTVFNKDNYGQEYFQLLGRVSDTKALKLGNIVFVLISEEHDPEGNRRLLTSVVPDKRFAFLENILKNYAQNNNIFVLSHTLLRGTTALSNDWSFNDIRDWSVITKKFFDLFVRYPVVGHLTGHIHIDYRYRARLKKLSGQKERGKVGKFIDGRRYDDLPDIYFLNMPCVDTAHSWLGSNFALLRQIGKATSKARRSPLRWLYMKLEKKGPPIFDILYRTRVSNIFGRAAVYYFDLLPGKKEVDIKTRWLRTNRDIETYSVDLSHPIKINSGRMRMGSSDLSIRTKDNLDIDRDNWFCVPANQQGWGEFSQIFPRQIEISGLRVKAKNLENYQVRWKGSRDGGKTWSKKWQDKLELLGRVNAVWLKIYFQAGNSQAKINDIVTTTIKNQ